MSVLTSVHCIVMSTFQIHKVVILIVVSDIMSGGPLTSVLS